MGWGPGCALCLCLVLHPMASEGLIPPSSVPPHTLAHGDITGYLQLNRPGAAHWLQRGHGAGIG